MRGKVHLVARPTQMLLQNSDVTKSKFTEFLWDVEVTSAVLTRKSMLRSSHPLWIACQRTEWRRGMPIFADWRQKSVTNGNVPSAIAKRI